MRKIRKIVLVVGKASLATEFYLRLYDIDFKNW